VKFEFVATSNWYPVAPEVEFQVTSIEFEVVLTVVGALVDAVVSGVVVSVPSAFTRDVGTRTHVTRTVRAMRMGDFIVRKRITVN
jgi:hypothetical protein